MKYIILFVLLAVAMAMAQDVPTTRKTCGVQLKECEEKEKGLPDKEWKCKKLRMRCVNHCQADCDMNLDKCKAGQAVGNRQCYIDRIYCRDVCYQ